MLVECIKNPSFTLSLSFFLETSLCAFFDSLLLAVPRELPFLARPLHFPYMKTTRSYSALTIIFVPIYCKSLPSIPFFFPPQLRAKEFLCILAFCPFSPFDVPLSARIFPSRVLPPVFFFLPLPTRRPGFSAFSTCGLRFRRRLPEPRCFFPLD